jgi:hypothetical protein
VSPRGSLAHPPRPHSHHERRLRHRRRRCPRSRRPDRGCRPGPHTTRQHRHAGRGWRLPLARFRPDPRSPLSDPVSRLCRRPSATRLAASAHLADGGGAHASLVGSRRGVGGVGVAAGRHDQRPDDGDGSRHRCGVRSARADRAASRRRQVHDGRRRQRPHPITRAHTGVDRREPRAGRALARAGRWPVASSAGAALCSLLQPGTAGGGRSPLTRPRADRAHPRLGEPG